VERVNCLPRSERSRWSSGRAGEWNLLAKADTFSFTEDLLHGNLILMKRTPWPGCTSVKTGRIFTCLARLAKETALVQYVSATYQAGLARPLFRCMRSSSCTRVSGHICLGRYGRASRFQWALSEVSLIFRAELTVSQRILAPQWSSLPVRSTIHRQDLRRWVLQNNLAERGGEIQLAGWARRVVTPLITVH